MFVLDELGGDLGGGVGEVGSEDAGDDGLAGFDGGRAAPVAGEDAVAVAVGDDDEGLGAPDRGDGGDEFAEVAGVVADVGRVGGEGPGVEPDQLAGCLVGGVGGGGLVGGHGVLLGRWGGWFGRGGRSGRVRPGL